MSPRLIATGIGVLAAVAAVWWLVAIVKKAERVDVAEAVAKQAVADLDSYRARVEEQARKDAIQLERDQRRDQVLTSRLAALQADNEALRRELARTPATVERAHADGRTCPVINPDRWLCLAAQLGRAPADIAACKARSGDGGLPDAIGN